MLSVIIPAYNEQAGLAVTFKTLEQTLSPLDMPVELVFVDDGSVDKTWEIIQQLRPVNNENRVRGIHFSRNFGKEAAIFAGLEAAKGDCVVVMDADLQHPPEKILDMVALWKQGYEVVEGIKEDRGEETGAHRGFSKLFYRLISRFSGLNMEDSSDFKLLDRKVVDALNRMPERNTFFRAMSFWAGYSRATVHYRVQDRRYGESKWSTFSLFRYAMRNIASFSVLPMQLVTFMGAIFFVFAGILSIIALVQKLSGRALGGFTTVIILLMFTGSIIMFSLGIIGFYIAQIAEEVKQRPRYLVSEEYTSEE